MLDYLYIHKYIWKYWKFKPIQVPQLWITTSALLSLGMNSTSESLINSADISVEIATVFNCRVISSQAGWFTTIFYNSHSINEIRQIYLVLLPFRWLDRIRQRPNDEAIFGIRNTISELVNDEYSEEIAVAELSYRISWLADLPVVTDIHKKESPLLPTSRVSSIGASLFDLTLLRKRSFNYLKSFSMSDIPFSNNLSLDPDLNYWRKEVKYIKNNYIDVEVDQRAAFLASSGHLLLGYGIPNQTNSNLEFLLRCKQLPFGLWYVTLPPGNLLNGLSTSLPLPHQRMLWNSFSTFWLTTRALQHLFSPVCYGGAGLSIKDLVIRKAFLWPKQATILRGWTEILRQRLAKSHSNCNQFQVDFLKIIYKSFLGRMSSSFHPPKRRYYQQLAWVSSIRADTRWRALRYATSIANTYGLYPIAAYNIDSFLYRIPINLNPFVLNESPNSNTGLYRNGSYRIKHLYYKGS